MEVDWVLSLLVEPSVVEVLMVEEAAGEMKMKKDARTLEVSGCGTQLQ